jgi:hypothetical protein
MATPHVAGAVGFLHSVMTSGFSQFQFNSPGEGALALKSMIMDGTDPISALENITVSGGRLNLFNSTILVSQFMASDSLDPNSITNLIGIGTAGTAIQLNWSNPTNLFGGDTISTFENDIYRDGEWIQNMESDVTSYLDTPVFPGLFYEYTIITRLVENDSTSVPVSVIVEAEAGECQLADPNMDGMINVMDIIKTLGFIMEWQTPTSNEFCAADINFDNELSIFDLLLISEIILGN